MADKSQIEVINISHQHSKDCGVNTSQSLSLIKVKDDELHSIQKKNTDLLSNCNSIIKEFLSPSENSILVITDVDGFILKTIGTSKSLNSLQNLQITEGVSLTEKSAGTNAIALAIKTKKHFLIENEQHYLNRFKSITSTATPIFNYNNRLIGVIGLFELQNAPLEQTQKMMKMAANAIADKFWNKLYQKKLNDERQFAFNIMNNLSYGLFAINLNEKIHWVNDTACRSLNIRRTNLLSKNIEEIIPKWSLIKRQLDNDKLLTDEEYNLTVNDSEENYIVNAYAVKDLNSKAVGYVVTLRPYSRMIKMLGRYSLNNSYFTFKNIIGNSEAIKHAIEIAKTAARSPSTILITGESGTGKEVFAQSIHNRSIRNENNFIAINCGAISSSLIESELFGYEEGAFTGALKKGRPGKFELANNGTIFLDEIGEMPHEMQVKLLRAIQEKTITRVGGSREIPIDVRIIAATNKNLQVEMNKGSFRADLFYRLSVIPLQLPSLRQRPKDIPLLMQFFLKQKGQLLSKPLPDISEDTMQQLLNYSWPGNVRELENTMEKLVLFDGNISNDSLIPISSTTIEPSTDNHVEVNDHLKSLDEVEKEAIKNTLHLLKWNISKSANTLGIGRNTLYEKIKKYKLEK